MNEEIADLQRTQERLAKAWPTAAEACEALAKLDRAFAKTGLPFKLPGARPDDQVTRCP